MGVSILSRSANLHYQAKQTQSLIANAPGSGSAEGNLLCGVGVVCLYPYSLESRPIGIKSYPALALLSPGSGDVDILIRSLTIYLNKDYKKITQVLLG
jgi:hypothetical protein